MTNSFSRGGNGIVVKRALLRRGSFLNDAPACNLGVNRLRNHL